MTSNEKGSGHLNNSDVSEKQVEDTHTHKPLSIYLIVAAFFIVLGLIIRITLDTKFGDGLVTLGVIVPVFTYAVDRWVEPHRQKLLRRFRNKDHG